jgi:DNA invertase Pin-like site-specific DNA recombinase
VSVNSNNYDTGAARLHTHRKFTATFVSAPPNNVKGDSVRRQLERSQKWCTENGYILDASLTMQDFGLSAYSGAHKAKGALGSFLKAIEAGAIQPGSILIVESLDRLSRQEITSAVGLFMSIIDADITIHTLMDGQTYSKDGINAHPVQIVMSIMVMMRSHDESRAKADRLSKAWQAKRDNLGKRKLTAIAPKWLKLNRESSSVRANPGTRQNCTADFSVNVWTGYGAYRITKKIE